MSVSVLGIDIAKQKFYVALLIDGKTKHKTCKNSVEGFETLMITTGTKSVSIFETFFCKIFSSCFLAVNQLVASF